MKPFTRVKNINGIDYVYEITPYYDPGTKTTKQKSKYLGKLVDGETKRMRKALPRNAFDFGDLLPASRSSKNLSSTRCWTSCWRRTRPGPSWPCR